MLKPTAAALAAVFLVVAATPSRAEETLLLLARHAEKQDDSTNPDLTPRGLARAEALADIAIDLNVAAVYSTDFCRTAQTAQPTASRLGMPIVVQALSGATDSLEHCTPAISSPVLFLGSPLDDVADLLSWILEQHPGKTVLIVGHSNTVPQMLERLGVGAFQIADDEYDRLFLVTLDAKYGARVVEQSYGEIYGDPAGRPGSGVERLPVVDRAIAFHGADAYRHSTARLTISSLSGSFDLVVTRRDSEFSYLVADRFDGAARTTLVTNERTERRIGGEMRALDPEQERRARDFVFARVYFPFLPYGLNDPEVFKQDQGLELWDERELQRVKVTFAPGSSSDAADDYAFWFDPATGRLEQYAYSFGDGTSSTGLRFRRLSNYRRVGGLLFADATNDGVSGSEDFSVDAIDQAWVESVAQPVSEVLLTNIEVESLGGD
jgi:phosphohistidine phosphatase SixA